MIKIPFRCMSKFRHKFECNVNNFTSWFPGHMYKGLLQMQAKLATVDCIIEVHDARIPFSGRNPTFYSTLYAIKPHILVLNKSDLADLSRINDIKQGLLQENIHHILFVSCKGGPKSEINKIVPLVTELVKDTDFYNRGNTSSFTLMVIGIPNVGKSSLINRLRNLHLKRKNATSVGAEPGVTRSVLEKIKISDEPLIYLYDTPGVLQPCIKNVEVGLRLALCRTLKDNLVGESLIADYLLYWLNKHQNFRYVEYLQLKEPVDNISLLLVEIAMKMNKVINIRNAEGSIIQVPDIQACSNYFIKAFRDGHFGKILLDSDNLNKSV